MHVPQQSIQRSLLSKRNRILNNEDFRCQIANILETKTDKIRLTNDQIQKFKHLADQVNNGSLKAEDAILRLRGGDGLIDVLAICAFIIFINWYDARFVTHAFQQYPLPHQDFFGWFNGNYNSPKNQNQNGRSLVNLASRFERDTLNRMHQMCLASKDENGFVMSYDEAYNLIKETYSGSMQITENCKLTDWQTAKKAYHFQKGFQMDMEKYPNFTKEDLVSLQKSDGGLIVYVQRSGKLPPKAFIKDCQQKIYDLCNNENTQLKDAVHKGDNTGTTPSLMFYNDETDQIALFNKTSGDLITASKYKRSAFEKYVNSGIMGSFKSSKNP